MKKHFPLILISMAIFLFACGYDYDPFTGRHDDYYSDDYIDQQDAKEYVRDNYSIGEVFDDDEIIEYITEKYTPGDIYDIDYLIDYLVDLDYEIIEP